jgi:hypothetical protein
MRDDAETAGSGRAARLLCATSDRSDRARPGPQRAIGGSKEGLSRPITALPGTTDRALPDHGPGRSTSPGRDYGSREPHFFDSHMTQRARFRDTELSYTVRHHPFRYKGTSGRAAFAAEIIDRFGFTTD